MNLKAVFKIQGVILILSGLLPTISADSFLQMNEMADINQGMLVLARGFGIMLVSMGVIVFRIPNWVGNHLREPAIVAGLINTAFVLHLGYDINAGHIGGASAMVNVIIVIVFAIIFFVLAARHQNS